MRKITLRICVIFTAVLFSISAYAQISLSDRNRHVNESAFYLELGGTGFYYSANYEHLIARNEGNLSLFARGGIEYIPFKVAEMVLHFPVGTNLIIGNKRSTFELGANALFRLDFGRAAIGDGYYLTNPPTRIFFSPHAGFRYHSKPNEYGETFLFRATFTPLIGFNVFSDQPFVKYWAGISIGRTWTFERKWKR